MKVYATTDNKDNEIKVEIHCREVTDKIKRLQRYVQHFDELIRGRNGEETVNINSHEILYIEAVDGKVFLYTFDKVYETDMKLYELEDTLDPKDFIRCSKSVIVNVNKIKMLRPEITRSVRATMVNNEVVIISRRYAGALKNLISGGTSNEQ